MANPVQTPIIATKTTDPEIKSFILSKETRKKTGDSTKEEYRWVGKATVVQRLFEVTSCDPLSSSENVTSTISGTMQGGPEVYLAASAGFNSANWTLLEEALVGMDQSGSQFVERTQLWVVVSAWADASWNAP